MKKSSSRNSDGFTPIAITGIGCIFPKSTGAKEFWRALFMGLDCVGEVPESHWSPSDYYDEDPQKPDHVYCKRGGFIDPQAYDPSEFGIPPSILEATDSSQLLGLIAAKMALNDAGYGEGGKEFNRNKTSVIIGATGTQELTVPLATRLGHPVWRRALNDAGIPSEKTEEVIKRISAGFVSWQESSFPGLLGNVIAGRIANRLDLGGTNCVVDAACGSSLGAIHLALLELLTGRSDMAITGGVDLLNDIFMHMCFAKTGVLSKSGDAKPFSENADGTVLGEGIGMLTLKRLEDAEKDGDRIYAVIKGAGSSSDGKSQSIYAPNAKGQEKALKKAYEFAGFSPATVDLVEAHGTGTRVGDAVEFNALRHVFSKREERNQIALGSVKSMIGHTKAAAGAAGMIKTALAIYNKVIPPTLKISVPDPKLEIENSPFYLPSISLPWFSNDEHPRRAGVSAFGFGGSNFHMALEEYKKDKNEPSWDGSIEIFAFSSDSREDLMKAFEKARNTIVSDGKMTSLTAYESRKSFDSKKNYRLLASALFDKVGEVFEKTKAMLDAGEKDYTSRSGSAYYAEGSKPGKIAFIFPGQGSQYTGMARELSCIFPEMMESIEKASSVFKGDQKLHDLIYPRSGVEEENESNLRNTSVAQPAIGAVSLGAMKILERFGIKPDSVCGHSFGELTALASAKSITEEDFFKLAVLRGKYMAEAGKGGDAGTMLAVKAQLADIEKMISETGVDVVLANRNSHDQGVLSGSAEAIEQAKQLCKERKMRGSQLNVAAAFHSKYVASAAVPFSKELEKIDFRKNEIPVFANTTAAPYPSSIEESRHLLGNQLVNSVNFVGIIETMHSSGVHTFIETGPKTVLTGLVKSILKGKAFECAATDDSSGKKSGLLDIATLLCKLAAIGHEIALENWETKPLVPRKPKMNIPISGTNYRSPEKIIKIPASEPMVMTNSSLLSANVSEVAIEKNIETKPEVENIKNASELKNVALSSNNDPIIAVNPQITDSAKNVSSGPERPPSMGTQVSSVSSKSADAAVRSINEGFKAMQSLQMQTTDAHKKFLETQMQASKTLETLMQKIGEISGMTSSVQAYANNVSSAPAQKTVKAESYPDSKPAYVQKTAEPEKAIIETKQAPNVTVVKTEIHSPKSASVAKADAIDPEKIKNALLGVVSDLTGYPVEMLDLDMDIESDLGIDSIKRVEILSAFEEKMPGAGNVDPSDLGRLKTLGQIIDHVSVNLPVNAQTANIPSSSKANIQAGPDKEKIKETLIDVVSNLTGYPAEMLDLDMDIESDLGIDSIKRVEILSAFEEKMPGAGNIDPSDLGTLKTLGQIIDYIVKISPSDSTIVLQDSSASVNKSADSDEIRVALLDVVSSLTGYPVEMLDLDMDIESDLGIDSIKRVEILSAFEEKMPGAGNIDPSDLGTLKTLGQIIKHVSTNHLSIRHVSQSGPSETATVNVQASSSGHDSEKIKDLLIEVVSSLTGYPSEMLDLDMDIESDLGIDSIKRVEILSAFEEKMPGIPPVQPDDLGKLKTLGQIISHINSLCSGSGSKEQPSAILSEAGPIEVKSADKISLPEDISRKTVNVYKMTGSASSEKIVLPDSGTVFVTGCLDGLGKEVAQELSSKGINVKTIDIDQPDQKDQPDQIDWAGQFSDNAAGLIIVADNSPESGIWKDSKADFLKKAFLAAKNASAKLCAAGKEKSAVFATITRLDGAFGFLTSNISDPMQGALPGLVKTARIEWPDVSCRAFDVSPFISDIKKTASLIADEILSKGPVETGFDDFSQYGLELEDVSFSKPVQTMGKNDVVIITGGARGVTAACAEELAEFCQPIMVLLGRSPEPEKEPAWLSSVNGEPAMKKAILDNEFKGKKATPQELEKSYRKFKAGREISETIDSIKLKGSKAFYYQADVRSHSDMEMVVDKIRTKYGSVSAIIHGAGVLEDRFIADKTITQFENVFGTKTEGLKNILDATRNDPLKAIVFFSSVSARMGNKGQVDYAMANEVLNKMAVYESSKRPGCRVVSINWGPWDGGMVNPALKKEFSRQGIDLIPIKSGAAAMVSEMCSSADGLVEVVIGAEFRHEDKPSDRKKDEVFSSDQGIVVKAGISEYPVLKDHMIGGKAVVPVAIMSEWFAHAALISNPGLHFQALENLRVLNGIKLDSESAEFKISASKPVKIDGLFKTDLEIRSMTKNGSERIHARATAVLGTKKAKFTGDKNTEPVYSEIPMAITAEDMYEKILFHGNSLKGVSEIKGLSDKGMTAIAATAPSPSDWIINPLRKKWVSDPLILDSAFQMASAWCYMNYGKVSLPSFAVQYIQYADKFSPGNIEISMKTKSVSGSRMSADFVFTSESGEIIAEIKGFESVMDFSLNQVFKKDGIKLKVVVPADLN
ncbi:type I polyketide synthase [Desulforegula conservatrix]|uniref:type I polyketide synthase n=1 Tax=Desulforegula conservatrix TaxID=153026 RepID=UPI0004887407|nr:type I polyketide synthase [Desulforegula conservatrix]